MFFPEAHIRVWLYGLPVDMRKSFDGLYALARNGLQQDPHSGALFAFVNRRGTQIKVLYFDRSGWCVWAKRLEAGQFIGHWQGQVHREMDCTGLKLLLEGVEVKRRHKRYRVMSEGTSMHAAPTMAPCSAPPSPRPTTAPR